MVEGLGSWHKAAESKRDASPGELEGSNAELQRFNRAVVGRELGTIELKRHINELSQQLGKEPPYDVSFVEEG